MAGYLIEERRIWPVITVPHEDNVLNKFRILKERHVQMRKPYQSPDRGSNPTAENFSLRNFGNSVYPALPVSFGGDTKRRRSLLSGVYARGSKIPHQSALECVDRSNCRGLHRPL